MNDFKIGDKVARRTSTNNIGEVVEKDKHDQHGVRVLWEECGSRKNVRTWIKASSLIHK